MFVNPPSVFKLKNTKIIIPWRNLINLPKKIEE